MSYIEIYAKMLAQENLSVTFDDKARTASFDSKNRLIIMPTFEWMTDTSRQAIVSHEVGHALFSSDLTPEEISNLLRKYGAIFNVLEDVYVESLLKKKYAGINTVFANGYKELSEQNFFCHPSDDIDTFNFIDRVNIYFKMSKLDIEFSEEEKRLLAKIKFFMNTRKDVLELTDEIYKFMKEENKKKKKEKKKQNDKAVLDDSESNNKTNQDNEKQTDKDNEKQASVDPTSNETEKDELDNTKEENSSQKAPEDDSEASEDEPEDEESEKNTSCSSNDFEKIENSEDFQEEPETSFEAEDCSDDDEDDDFILESETMKNEENFFNTGFFVENNKETVSINGTNITWDADISKTVIYYWNEYKKPIGKKIHNEYIALVKNSANSCSQLFNTKKSAKAQREAKLRKTGRIDPRRLAHYKTSENIFKSKKVSNKEQNHSIVFLIDFSGSIADVLLPSMIQVCSFAEFCYKNKIKFDILAFGLKGNGYDDKNVFKIASSDCWNADAIINFTILLIKKRIMSKFHFQYTPLARGLFSAAKCIKEHKRLGIEKTYLYIFTDGSPQCDYIDFTNKKRDISGVNNFSYNGDGDKFIINNIDTNTDIRKYVKNNQYGFYIKHFNGYASIMKYIKTVYGVEIIGNYIGRDPIDCWFCNVAFKHSSETAFNKTEKNTVTEYSDFKNVETDFIDSVAFTHRSIADILKNISKIDTDTHRSIYSSMKYFCKKFIEKIA